MNLGNKNQTNIHKILDMVLFNFQNKPLERETILEICGDLQILLGDYLKNNHVYERDFPISYKNNMGDWLLKSDGTLLFNHIAPINQITIKTTINENSNR